MDTHRYYAWWPRVDELEGYCNGISGDMRKLQSLKYDVWVGEWSLATDTCAFWLDNFNDSKSPRTDACQWVECPKPYLPKPLGVDMDRHAYMQGPFGTNTIDVARYGMCPIDSDKFSFDELTEMGQCVLDAYNSTVDAHIMWTFRNELEPRWSYLQAYDAGWIKQSDDDSKAIQN